MRSSHIDLAVRKGVDEQLLRKDLSKKVAKTVIDKLQEHIKKNKDATPEAEQDNLPYDEPINEPTNLGFLQ